MTTFGLSTHLFQGERLTAAHIAAIAAHGFDLVEVFATRTHVDYRDPACVGLVRDWIDGHGLRTASVHLPIATGCAGGVWGRAYSIASADPAARAEAVDETRRGLDAAAQLGAGVAVLHLGRPDGPEVPAADNEVSAARRSLEAIAAHAHTAGVRIALEVIPNTLSTPASLVTWLDGDLEPGAAGVCLDVGHAHLMGPGGAPEAAEVLSGWIVTTHLHDNRGRTDDHLAPLQGTIDWAATLMALSKVGYTGPLMFEVADQGDAAAALGRAVGARRRLQGILEDLAAPFEFDL